MSATPMRQGIFLPQDELRWNNVPRDSRERKACGECVRPKRRKLPRQRSMKQEPRRVTSRNLRPSRHQAAARRAEGGEDVNRQC